MKRFFDVIVSFFAILLLLPAMLILFAICKVAILGKRVLFRQLRVGRHGKLFQIVTIRTMKERPYNSSVSVAGESRILPFGAWLRRNKLDELPELWNVLVG